MWNSKRRSIFFEGGYLKKVFSGIYVLFILINTLRQLWKSVRILCYKVYIQCNFHKLRQVFFVWTLSLIKLKSFYRRFSMTIKNLPNKKFLFLKCKVLNLNKYKEIFFVLILCACKSFWYYPLYTEVKLVAFPSILQLQY